MYLKKAKKLFDDLLKLEPINYESCTVTDIEELKHFLNLPIPKVYEELLLWIGKGCEPLYSYGGGYYYSTKEGDLRSFALAIMKLDQSSALLPEDAIVFWLFDEDSSFAFVRAFEGDNPPVHFYGPIKKDGVTQTHTLFQWSWYQSLDDLFLVAIEDYMYLSELSNL